MQSSLFLFLSLSVTSNRNIFEMRVDWLLRLLIDSFSSKRREREKIGRQRAARKKRTDAVGPRWLRLDDLAFLSEETRGDLGSRPPLRRYGYAEVNDNGTSSSLPLIVFLLLASVPASVSSSFSSSSSPSLRALRSRITTFGNTER